MNDSGFVTAPLTTDVPAERSAGISRKPHKPSTTTVLKDIRLDGDASAATSLCLHTLSDVRGLAGKRGYRTAAMNWLSTDRGWPFLSFAAPVGVLLTM